MTRPNWWYHRIRRELLRHWLPLRGQDARFRRHVTDLATAGPSVPAGNPRRVAHFISALNPGGAERQLTYLASRTAQRGIQTRLLTFGPPEDNTEHYASVLRADGVPIQRVTAADLRVQAASGGRPGSGDGVQVVPPRHVARALWLADVLRAQAPDVLHCWLDTESILGGIAAILAGVPRVILSTRSLNPDHFYWTQPWYRDWYRTLLACPQVRLLNNSACGARDYESWLGAPEGTAQVVLNGMDFSAFGQPSASREEWRRRVCGTAPGYVIAGVMRLSPQKRPGVFVDVAERVLAREPAAHMVLAGTGTLDRAIARRIARSPYAARMHQLGSVADVATLLAHSDVAVLTSEVEGTPNVLIEAQYLGVPVVTTRAGGAPETMVPGRTGFVADVDDVAGLTRHVCRLLRRPELRRQMGEDARAFVAATFSIDRMVDETLAAYSAP